MDNRLKFLYHHEAIERWGDAGRQGERADGSARPSRKAGNEANPVTERLSGDGEGNKSTEAPELTLPRKASSEQNGARTRNRHR